MCAGVGWLYLLRGVGAVAAGPRVSGALPLEELARHGAQPLLRMAVAWLPAGFAVGLALRLGAGLRAPAVAIGCGLLSLVLLGSSTAASEAVSRNERFGAHVLPALHRSGVWTAVAFAVIGSLLAVAALRGGPRRRGSDATDAAGSGSAAA